MSEAREAIRLGEERKRELEAEIRQITRKAADDLAAVKAELQQVHLQFLEAKAAEANAVNRAVEAERRAADAEGWLMRLHKSVVDAFGPLSGARPSQSDRLPEPRTTSAARRMRRPTGGMPRFMRPLERDTRTRPAA